MRRVHPDLEVLTRGELESVVLDAPCIDLVVLTGVRAPAGVIGSLADPSPPSCAA